MACREAEPKPGSSGPTALVAVVLVLVVMGACARDRDDAVERRLGALSSPTTVGFQDGTNGYAGAADTQIVQNAPATNYGTATSLSADGDDPSGSGRDTAILLRWDLSSIPAGSTVQSASITVRVNNPSTNSYPVLALGRSWSESSATWQLAASGSSWQTPGALGAGDRDLTSLATLTASATGAYTVAVNAAGLAKLTTWIDQPSLNFGFVVASTSNADGLDIATRESATVANRPRLTIVYLPPASADAGSDVPTTGTAGIGGPGGNGGGGGMSGSGGGGGMDGGGGTSGSAGAAGGGSGTGAGGISGMGGLSGTSGTLGTAGALQTDAATDTPLPVEDAAGASDRAGDDAAGAAGTTGAAGTAGAAGAGGSGGAPSPVVLYAVGDVTDCELVGDTATALLVDGSTDPIALLGDIAYPNGSASDFANCFHPPWGRHKARIRPAPGNHEYNTPGASGYYDYFGGAAGDPAKGYYSYELGAWHVVVLNSNCSAVGCAAGSGQEQWLRQDLAAHPTACTLAYWHHPRFSSGSHGNATSMGPIWQALVDSNADLVLAGHDHGYQRLHPLNRNGAQVPNGIVSFVVGTGGAPLSNSFSGRKPANTAVRNGNTNGLLKLTLNATSYDFQFVPIAGQSFTDTGSASCH